MGRAVHPNPRSRHLNNIRTPYKCDGITWTHKRYCSVDASEMYIICQGFARSRNGETIFI